MNGEGAGTVLFFVAMAVLVVWLVLAFIRSTR